MAARSSPLAERGGRLVREARLALGLSQRDLARRTGIPQTSISRFERGRPSAVDLARLDRIAGALGGRIGLTLEAPFLADRASQHDGVHARCVGHVAARLGSAGWLVMTEVEIQGSGGPGWIDVLAFHPTTGLLLVVEVKTEVHDFGRIQRTIAWYERRAEAAARSFGWRVRTTHASLLLLMTDAVDAALVANRQLAAAAFPVRARELGPLAADPLGVVIPAGRSLAMIDPLSRRGAWVRATRARRAVDERAVSRLRGCCAASQ